MIDDDGIGAQELLTRNLRRLRIARHLSLSALARTTGISKATLSGIENGRANPTLDTLTALAAALRVSLGELLEQEELGEVRVVRAARSDRRGGEDRPMRVLERLGRTAAAEVLELSLHGRQLLELPARTSGDRTHVYVSEGRLIAGPVDRISELAPGDYASFPAEGPQVFEAVRAPARALLILATSG